MHVVPMPTTLLPQPDLEAFTHLRASVKSNIDIALEPCTAIVGPNKSQKTGVLDTIKLAITGKHPIGANAADLAELSLPGADRMEAILTGPSGIARFLQEIPGGKARKPTHEFTGPIERLSPEDRAHILPIESIGDLVRFGSSRAREALMHRFGVAANVPVPIGLNSKQHTMWDAAKTACADAGDPAKQLATMAKWFRTEKLARSKKAYALDEAVTQRKAALETQAAGSELLADYERKLKLAEAWERTASLRVRKGRLEDKMAALRVEARNLLDREQEHKQLHGTAPADDPTVFETQIDGIATLRAKAANAVETGNKLLELLTLATDTGTCPMCLTAGVDVTTTKARVELRSAERQDEVNQHDATLRDLRARLTALQHAIGAFVSDPFAEAKTNLKREAERVTAELDGVNAGLTDAPADYVGPVTGELRQEIGRIKAAELTRIQLFDDARDMHLLRDESEVCKVLEREAAKLLKDLLKNVADTAETAVNKYMPLGFQARLIITDKAVEWRVLGTDDRPHKRGGMSGSEFGSLVVAVACAWTDGSPLRILLLDDVDLGPFDPANLHALLDCLQAAVTRGDLTQVIVAWSRASEIPAGWHKVYRGA